MADEVENREPKSVHLVESVDDSIESLEATDSQLPLFDPTPSDDLLVITLMLY